MKILRKIFALIRKRKLEIEMTEEMRHHVELQTELNVKAGMNPDEARYSALRQFGNVALIQERAREGRGWVLVEQTIQDLRYAFRSLRRNPGFTATAVLVLALGIGVNAALFTVYDIIALRPLPCRAPDELVDIQGINSHVKIDRRFSYPDYLDFCGRSSAFSAIVAARRLDVRLPADDSVEADSILESAPGLVTVQAVSGNYLSVLGAEVVLGRDFRPEEAGTFSGRTVAVLSHLFWQTRFHSDPDILGKTLITEAGDGKGRTIYTIIGVAAPDFVGQSSVPPACWVPLTAVSDQLANRDEHLLYLLGRMRPGVVRSQAKADLDSVAEGLARLYPAAGRATAVHLSPAMMLFDTSDVTARGTIAFSALLLGFVLVLLLSCLNVANLLLARGVTRQHEIGVRLSLGASRVRIVKQLFTENLALCFGGASLGLLFAFWTLQTLRPLAAWLVEEMMGAGNVVSLIPIGPDWRIVVFTAILAAFSALAAGLVPAVHSASFNLFGLLKDEGSALGLRIRPARLRHALVIAQVAVCLGILSVNGIMAGNLFKIRQGDLGFSTERVFLVRIPPKGGISTSATAPLDLTGTVETLRTLPGVASACVVRLTPLRTPFENAGWTLIKIPGNFATSERFGANWISVGFFDTFGVPLREGRGFTPQEVANGAPVVVVSERAAHRLWPGREAVGQILSIRTDTGRNDGPVVEIYRDCEVVGVAGDFRSNWVSVGGEEPPLVLFPLPVSRSFPGVYVRVQADSAAILSGIVKVAMSAGIPLEFRERLSSVIERGLLPFRLMAGISGLLAGLALVLATVGLYGIMAFAVNQRVREIGVRVALGATTEKITGLFIREGMRRVTIGIVLGLTGGIAFVMGITKVFPQGVIADGGWFRVAVFGGVTVFLGGVALIASWLPARRAANVDPVVALRAE